MQQNLQFNTESKGRQAINGGFFRRLLKENNYELKKTAERKKDVYIGDMQKRQKQVNKFVTNYIEKVNQQRVTQLDVIKKSNKISY